MDVLLSPEHEELIDAVRRVVAARMPLTVERAAASEPDDALWHELAALGWFGLALGEEVGGTGLGVVEEALLFRELGRVLAAGPFIGTVLGARLAAAGGDPGLATRIMQGEVRIAVAEQLTPMDGAAPGEWLVLDATTATHAVAAGEDGARLVSLAGADLQRRDCIDATVSMHVGRLPDGAASTVAIDDLDVRREGRVLVAASLAGMAEATRDASVAYAKVREQFGKPIGAFQAVSHRCADMATRAELAYRQTLFAALSIDEAMPGAAAEAVAAKVVAVEAARANASDNIQNHGGIGFASELPAHRFVNRWHVLARLFGSHASCLDELASTSAA